MNKLLPFTYLFLFFAFTSLQAQNFPYLNASTGNENQYIVDADTNIYMFHGNQLEKVDKHFNPIWVKTYDSLNFYSLLLSKTGSIYFIAKNEITYSLMNFSYSKYVGKLDYNGNISWIKTIEHPDLINISTRSLLLDRNNHLMISGEGRGITSGTFSALLMKLDTLGNMLHCNYFTGPQPTNLTNVTLLNDSAGYYTCIYSGNFFESSAIGKLTYCEAGDSIYSEAYTGEYLPFYMIVAASYYKSRKNADVYYSISQHDMSIPSYIYVKKYTKNNVLWSKKFMAFYGSTLSVNSFDEDDDKSIFFTISPNRGGLGGFYSNCFKLDSNGIFSGHYNTLLSYAWGPPSSLPESAKLHAINNNKFVYDVIGYNFPSNPLSVTFLDSLLTTNCSTSTVLTMSNSVSGPIQNSQPLLSTYFTSPYLLTDYSPAVTVISDFMIDPNYCLALTINEISQPQSIGIFPNPVSNILSVKFPVEHTLINLNIFDINGKPILSANTNAINVTALSPGLYFVKLKTDLGEYSRKFIKE